MLPPPPRKFPDIPSEALPAELAPDPSSSNKRLVGLGVDGAPELVAVGGRFENELPPPDSLATCSLHLAASC